MKLNEVEALVLGLCLGGCIGVAAAAFILSKPSHWSRWSEPVVSDNGWSVYQYQTNLVDGAVDARCVR